jgi:hypothetical protein
MATCTIPYLDYLVCEAHRSVHFFLRGELQTRINYEDVCPLSSEVKMLLGVFLIWLAMFWTMSATGDRMTALEKNVGMLKVQKLDKPVEERCEHCEQPLKAAK